jgi:hypothetical protein
MKINKKIHKIIKNLNKKRKYNNNLKKKKKKRIFFFKEFENIYIKKVRNQEKIHYF